MVELLQKRWLFNKRFVLAEWASCRTGEEIFCNLVVLSGLTAHKLSREDPTAENGVAVHPTGRNFNFTCCNFYGRSEYAYDGGYTFSHNHVYANNFNAKFINCNFFEEYTDPSTNITSSIVAKKLDVLFKSEDKTDDPNNCSPGDVYRHHGLIDFVEESAVGNPCCRVLFDNCRFNTGYFLKFGGFKGGAAVTWNGNQPFINYQILKNCSFTNTGLCSYINIPPPGDCDANRQLAWFDAITFEGTPSFYWPVHPRNNNNTCNDCYYVRYYLNSTTINTVPFDPTTYISDLSCPTQYPPYANETYGNCYQRYKDPTDYIHWEFTSTLCDFPYHYEVSEYCIDETCSAYEPQTCYCPQCTRNAAPVTSGHKPINVYPVPSSGSVVVENSNAGDVIILRNTTGEELLRIISQGNQIELPLQTCPPGVYYIHAGTSTSKIIKL